MPERIEVTVGLPTPDDTSALGARLATILQPGDIVALKGHLGAGKTSLCRGLISALIGPETEVPSPTYTLVQTYDTPIGEVWHMDLYRLKEPDEALELGIEDAFVDAICLIEWPERLDAFLPAQHLDVTLETVGSGRRAILRGGPEWEQRLRDL